MSDNRDERLSLAVDAYKNSPLSLADLSAYYNIPISTIRRHANGINQSTKPGPKTVLSEATEILFKRLIIYMCDIGFSLNKDAVLDVVENYCIRTGQDIFKKQRPSSEWFELYMKRHPALSKRIGNNMQSHRAVAMNKEHILFWFNKLKEVFDEHDLYNHPDRLWNCDESGLQCNGGRCQIICRKGSKNLKLITSANEKKHWTILSCCNANGVYLPHNIIYQGKNLYSNWMLHGREDFVYNTSESGWMETEQFLNWFKQVFLKHVNKQPGYKVLFLDGHSSHISLELIDCARQNNVILFKLPSHTSHVLQPLDVGVFKTVKQHWRKLIQEFMKKNKYQSFSNKKFSIILKQLVNGGAFKRENAIAGFEASGLFPFNPDKILESESIQIGTAFHNTPNTPQTPTPRVIRTINSSNLTPVSARSFKKGEHETMLNSLLAMTGDAIAGAVGDHLNKYHQKKDTNKENIRINRDSNYNLTMDEVRQQISDKIDEKKRKEEELAQKKLAATEKKKKMEEEKETKRIERERKKEMRLATQAEKAEKKPKKTRNSKRKIDEVEPESETQEQDSQTKAFGFGRFCYVCNEEFGPNSDSVKWWPCEGRNCSNWCCGCESDLDYTCKYCKKL
jgi:hypothetical protein